MEREMPVEQAGFQEGRGTERPYCKSQVADGSIKRVPEECVPLFSLTTARPSTASTTTGSGSV